jgi:hypothetical protein
MFLASQTSVDLNADTGFNIFENIQNTLNFLHL